MAGGWLFLLPEQQDKANIKNTAATPWCDLTFFIGFRFIFMNDKITVKNFKLIGKSQEKSVIPFCFQPL
jgi:hypothetical protein